MYAGIFQPVFLDLQILEIYNLVEIPKGKPKKDGDLTGFFLSIFFLTIPLTQTQQEVPSHPKSPNHT